MSYSSYKQGHKFEKCIKEDLIKVIQPDIIECNVLFKSRHVFEIDIFLIKNNKLLLIECKDYKGIIEYFPKDNIMMYRGFRIKNFVTHQHNKVNRFNEEYNVKSKGVIIVNNTTGIVNVPYTIKRQEIYKINNVLYQIEESNLSNLGNILNPIRQSELRREVGWRE